LPTPVSAFFITRICAAKPRQRNGKGTLAKAHTRVRASAMSPATLNVASRSASVASKDRPPMKTSVAA
jgi:hypothetical protein